MPRRATPPLLSSLVLVAAASCAAPPPAASPEPAPAPPAPSAAPIAEAPEVAASAKPAAPPAPPAAPALSLPPPITEALPPLSRAFLSVPMPGVKGHLTSISGRGPRDVWILTGEEYPDPRMKMYIKKGIVIRHDGQRVVKKIEPDCFGAMFQGLQISKDGVILSGSNPYVRAPPVETGLFDGKGGWVCSNAYATVQAASPSQPAWTLNCGSSDGRGCYLQAAGGKRAALPATHASFGPDGRSTPLDIATWQMRGDDDGWMVFSADGHPKLFRYNGVTWVPKAALDGIEITGMSVSDDGQVWLLAARDNQSSIVLRFDGHALHPLPVPASFGPTRVIGAGAREVWFFGKGRKVYQWDGQRLRQGEVGFEVSDGWAAPNGEVWIVGGTGNPEDESAKPMAVRTPPFPEGR